MATIVVSDFEARGTIQGSSIILSAFDATPTVSTGSIVLSQFEANNDSWEYWQNSNTTDGFITSTSTSYANARSGSGSTKVVNTSSGYLADSFNSGFDGTNYVMTESFYSFDTTGLVPAGATVTDVYLSLYIGTPKVGTLAQDIYVIDTAWNGTTLLATTDWIANGAGTVRGTYTLASGHSAGWKRIYLTGITPGSRVNLAVVDAETRNGSALTTDKRRAAMYANYSGNEPDLTFVTAATGLENKITVTGFRAENTNTAVVAVLSGPVAAEPGELVTLSLEASTGSPDSFSIVQNTDVTGRVPNLTLTMAGNKATFTVPFIYPDAVNYPNDQPFVANFTGTVSNSGGSPSTATLSVVLYPHLIWSYNSALQRKPILYLI